MAAVVPLLVPGVVPLLVPGLIRCPDGERGTGQPAPLLRFILWGSGAVAPVTREILRRAEPGWSRRPHVHAG